MAGCNCNAGLGNTGRPGCVPIQSVTSKLIMVPLTANDGTSNRIDLINPLPTWNDLVNEADPSKRWFPLPAFENVELPKAESQFEEANSGRMAFLREGKRSFTGELWGEDSTPTLLGKMKAGRCVGFGVYIVDVQGNLIGSKVGDYLYPIPVDNQSWNPTFMFATDSTVQKIMLTFDFDRLFDDSTMYMITATEAGIDFNTLAGLIDVNIQYIASALNDVIVQATFDYGTALNPIYLQGVTGLTDWSFYDDTNQAAYGNPTAVSESAGGVYTLMKTFVLGDSYTLTVVKDGFTGSVQFTA